VRIFTQKNIRKQDGQSLVEFALVMPVFIILLFGIMEFGRLWEVSNILTSAAREGARVAAVTAPDVEAVSGAVQNVLDAGQITNAQIQISGPTGSNEISVTLTLDYEPMSGVVIPGLTALTISRSTTMRWEG